MNLHIRRFPATLDSNRLYLQIKHFKSIKYLKKTWESLFYIRSLMPKKNIRTRSLDSKTPLMIFIIQQAKDKADFISSIMYSTSQMCIYWQELKRETVGTQLRPLWWWIWQPTTRKKRKKMLKQVFSYMVFLRMVVGFSLCLRSYRFQGENA